MTSRTSRFRSADERVDGQIVGHRRRRAARGARRARGTTPRNSPARSMAPMSDASSTTQMIAARRDAGRGRSTQSSSSVRLKHRRTDARAHESVDERLGSRRLCSGGCSQQVVRETQRRLSGRCRSCDSSRRRVRRCRQVVRSAAGSERELERQVHAAGHLAHLALLHRRGRLLLRVAQSPRR